MGLLTYAFILTFAGLAAYIVLPSQEYGNDVLIDRIASAITQRKALDPPADLHALFDGPTPWPGTVSKIVGALASKSVLAHEVSRSELPERVSNIRGPAAYFLVEASAPYYVALTTGQPQLMYWD